MRAIAFDPELRAVRTYTLSNQVGAPLVLRWPDSVVSAAMHFSSRSAGWPLHLLTFREGGAHILRSFGPERGELTPERMGQIGQVVAGSRTGGFWSADRVQYRVHRWTRALERDAVFIRRPDWFPNESLNWIGNRTTPPPPQIVGLTETQGALMVVLHRAAKTWRAAWAAYPDRATEVPSTALDIEKLFEVVVEALDTRTGGVQAAVVWAGHVLSVLPEGRAAVLGASASGESRVFIVRLRLLGAP
jgi:hypothetical protein